MAWHDMSQQIFLMTGKTLRVTLVLGVASDALPRVTGHAKTCENTRHLFTLSKYVCMFARF